MENIEVKEIFEISNATMLVCDLFDDCIITDKLITDIGVFHKGEFSVEQLTVCFGKPNYRIIGIEKKNLPQIHTVRFE